MKISEGTLVFFVAAKSKYILANTIMVAGRGNAIVILCRSDHSRPSMSTCSIGSKSKVDVEGLLRAVRHIYIQCKSERRMRKWQVGDWSIFVNFMKWASPIFISSRWLRDDMIYILLGELMWPPI